MLIVWWSRFQNFPPKNLLTGPSLCRFRWQQWWCKASKAEGWWSADHGMTHEGWRNYTDNYLLQKKNNGIKLYTAKLPAEVS